MGWASKRPPRISNHNPMSVRGSIRFVMCKNPGAPFLLQYKLPASRIKDSLPEWSKGVDSSSTSASCVGSNPTAVTFRCRSLAKLQTTYSVTLTTFSMTRPVSRQHTHFVGQVWQSNSSFPKQREIYSTQNLADTKRAPKKAKTRRWNNVKSSAFRNEKQNLHFLRTEKSHGRAVAGRANLN